MTTAAQSFVHEAIARSLLTLPFAAHDANDPFGRIYGYYKHLVRLLDASTSGLLKAPSNVLAPFAPIVELIEEDIAVHEAAGNFLKAAVERQWCVGLQQFLAEKV